MNWTKFLDKHASKVGGFSLGLGFFMLIGTMGAFELDSIEAWQIVLQLVMSVALLVVGFSLVDTKEKQCSCSSTLV